MGTNYYWTPNRCEHCGRSDDQVHIGKSSYGWCFSLHVHPDGKINTLADWQERWASGGVITDEYDEVVPTEVMMEFITEREGRLFGKQMDWLGMGYPSEAAFHMANYSERGPNGLLRHRICTPNGCVGHGEGTWDYITGDFS